MNDIVSFYLRIKEVCYRQYIVNVFLHCAYLIARSRYPNMMFVANFALTSFKKIQKLLCLCVSVPKSYW